MHIALVGGRTAGPIMPLLAVGEYIQSQHPDTRLVIFDVKSSVGSHIAQARHILFVRITTDKLRRYWSWRTVFTPFLIICGLIQALVNLRKHRINRVVGAGGFVQVPVVWAAWLLRIPVHIHQQDIIPTLSNTLCAVAARSISVTFAPSLRDFRHGFGLFHQNYHSKITLTGNPCRRDLLQASRLEGQKYFQLDKSWPTLFVLGGGTGAQGINQLIYQALPELCRTVQIIHSTGTGRGTAQTQEFPRYYAQEFIDRTDLAYAAADIVLARAGISTITELANLGKVSMIIPMPDSHQEYNAQWLYDHKAALVFDQRELTPALLVKVIRKLLFDLPLQETLQQNIRQIMPLDSAKKIAQLII